MIYVTAFGFRIVGDGTAFLRGPAEARLELVQRGGVAGGCCAGERAG